ERPYGCPALARRVAAAPEEAIRCIVPGSRRMPASSPLARWLLFGPQVVVEAVIGALVDMTLVRHLRLRQGGVEGGPSVGDARVEFAVLRIYRRLDLGRVGSARLSSVEGNSSSQIRAHP